MCEIVLVEMAEGGSEVRKKKVVIFTGGGYFGVTFAAFLSYLPEDYLLPKQVDVLAGTAIGGIITCALMAGCAGKQILDGFVKEGKRIFTRRWQNGTKVNDDVNLVTQISIIADSYLLENMHCIRYAKINGVAWEVTSIDPQHPRLLLDLGGVYNGETA